ncbi:hypothetical protein H4R35_007388 [Dimargaris xerosporica]|nr:hypothetical protein H4R35_007388 [Dimargaris xerosporica]
MTEFKLESAKAMTGFFTVLVGVSGLGLIGLGIYALAATHLTFSGRTWIPIFMMVMGVLVFALAFLGCFGAMLERRYMVMTYGAILLLLTVVELMLAIYALVYQVTVEVGLDAAWQNAYDRHPKLIREIQDEYGCCGFKKVTDRAIPKSSPNACVESSLFGYHRACFDILQRNYQTELRSLAFGELALVALQALALLSATLFYKQLCKRHEDPASVTEDERRALLHDAHASPHLPPATTNHGAIDQRAHTVSEA